MAGFNWLWTSAVCVLHVGRTVAQTTALPDWFNGYYIHLDGTTTDTSSVSCESTMSWASSGEYANCCQTTDTNVRCPMPTACVSSTVVFDDGSSYTCNPNESCATMTVYQTSPFGLPSSKQAFCWENWEAFTVYRELPTPTGSTSATATEGASLNAPTASNTGANAQDDNSGQPASQGWIAGAVVGPVAGVALGVFGLLFGYRKARQAKQMQAMTAPPYEPFGSQAMPMHTQHQYQQHPYVELDSSGIYQKP
ncbi:hypothetical protein BDV59DRAFT_206496 [Aspergillus ambiguus]|uniref:uncharacterized protein n=1 Tax=Aspergillus ambiguus TaxID=176160 RepID=UPI003CCCB55C